MVAKKPPKHAVLSVNGLYLRISKAETYLNPVINSMKHKKTIATKKFEPSNTLITNESKSHKYGNLKR